MGISTYKGLTVLSPSPSGDGGNDIQADLMILADRCPGTSVSAEAPTTAWDAANGYFRWWKHYDSAEQKMYICLDNTTGAAIWQEVGAGGGGGGGDVTNPLSADLDVGTYKIKTSSNRAMVLNPHGTGALQLRSDGNARGNYALDFSRAGLWAAQIAGGAYSSILGGQNNQIDGTGTAGVIIGGVNNRVTGEYSAIGAGYGNSAAGDLAAVAGGGSNSAAGDYGGVVAGDSNQASGRSSLVGSGSHNVASGDRAVVVGGETNTASGTYSAIGGGANAVANHYGEHAQASGSFGAVAGTAQTMVLTARGVTRDITTEILFLDGDQARLTIPDNCLWTFCIHVAALGNLNAAGDMAGGWRIEGVIDRHGGTTTLHASTTTELYSTHPGIGWTPGTAADTDLNALLIPVAGFADAEVRWVARIEITQVAVGAGEYFDPDPPAEFMRSQDIDVDINDLLPEYTTA